MKVTALAGGVGGARLAAGLQAHLGSELSVIVNTGDDFMHLGLHICPDLDTVCYTLAGLANPETGWGRAGESFRALEALETLGAPTWFRLGDLDLATHLERTRRLQSGETLTQVTAALRQAWGVPARVLPMSDQPVPTMVQTASHGELPFQDYFVRLGCQPVVTGFRFHGIEHAAPTQEVLDALRSADAILICPSNPWVSIAPILTLPGVLTELDNKILLAVSPIIGGKAVKGPAAKMYAELGIEPSAQAVAEGYGRLSGFVIDHADAGQAEAIESVGTRVLITDALMRGEAGQKRLAGEILDWIQSQWT